MELTAVVEIEQSSHIAVPITAFNTPLWKINLWLSDYNPSLSFFASVDPVYPNTHYSVSSIIIDETEYLQVNSLETCYENDETWCFDPNDNSIIYIHFYKNYSPLAFYSRKIGIIEGYTNNGYKKLGDYHQAIDLIQSLPTLSFSADNLEYNKMKFISGNVALNNTLKTFDKSLNVFGYDLNILLGEKEAPYEQYQKLIQFYISNYEISPQKAVFQGKDKRELLSKKIPNTRFAQTVPPNRIDLYQPGLIYPYINDNLIDQIIPDVYGYCFRVPGICLNENQATTDRWRHFKFSRKITSALNDIDFILEAQIGKKWIKLPRNETEYNALGFQGTYDPDTMWLAAGPVEYDSYNPVTGETTHVNWREEGTVSIPVIWAHDQEGQTWATDVEGGLNEIRLSAKFNPQEKPLDILLDILEYYADIAPIPENYALSEMYRELDKLPPIGVAFLEEQDIYKAIESFQNGSLLGFQLINKFNLLSVVLDNPNRPKTFDISSQEILNFDEISIAFGNDNYATWADIIYAYGYQDKKGLHSINKEYRESLLDTHRFDKKYETTSKLANKADADLKASVLMQLFNQNPITIKGVKLLGLEYFNLDLYQIGTIDLQGIKDRIFFIDEIIRVQIVAIKKGPNTGFVTIDFKQKTQIPNLPPDYGINLMITGEYPDTTNYEVIYDNRYADSTNKEFRYRIDGGGVYGD